MDSAYGYENGLVRRQPNEADLESVIVICWRLLWLASTLGRGNDQVLTNRSRFGAHAIQLFTDPLMVYELARSRKTSRPQFPFDRLIVLMVTRLS